MFLLEAVIVLLLPVKTAAQKHKKKLASFVCSHFRLQRFRFLKKFILKELIFKVPIDF